MTTLNSTTGWDQELDIQGARARGLEIKTFLDDIAAIMNASTGHTHDGTTDQGPPLAAAGLAADAVTTAKILDANVTSAKLAEDVLRKATVTLTATQVKALNTTPIELVAAPGATKFIDVVAVHAKLVFNTTAYTGTNNLEFRYTDGSGAKVAADISSTFINTASGTAVSTAKGQEAEVVNVLNGPVVVAVPVANPAAGDSPIDVTVYYRVVTP